MYIGGRQCTEAWKFIKNGRTSEKRSVHLQMIPIDRWVQYYQDLLTENRTESEGTENITHKQIGGESVEVSEERVRKAVRELKNGKSCGPEGVYAEMLKHGTDRLITMLTWIINRCLNGEEVPQQWKFPYISSIHKKGSKKDCSNYRDISVTSVMSRLYGKILRDFVEEENKDEEEQNRFRKGRSCTDNIFCLKQVIEKMKATNQETHILFVDLTKA
jgi:hypothetical protein